MWVGTGRGNGRRRKLGFAKDFSTLFRRCLRGLDEFFSREIMCLALNCLKLYAGRYTEHGVGRNWRCDLGVYCSKPDKE